MKLQTKKFMLLGSEQESNAKYQRCMSCMMHIILDGDDDGFDNDVWIGILKMYP